MATPQSFFGGTKPKSHADPTLNQVGHKSATPGVNSITNNRGMADTSTHANLSTRKLYRPNIPGKVDNRKVGH